MPHPALLSADRVWSGDGAPHPGWSVLVASGRIAAVEPAASMAVPADAGRIDLPGATLLPGLIDLHAHLFLHPYHETSGDDQVRKEAPAWRTALALRHAADTLQAGFTTLRDLGTEGAGYADVGVKRAIDGGAIPGPRLLVATLAIVATGSYGPAERSYRAPRAATVVAARILGKSTELGALRTGLLADVIAVDGNPGTVIPALQKVTLVMKGGVIYRQPSH